MQIFKYCVQDLFDMIMEWYWSLVEKILLKWSAKVSLTWSNVLTFTKLIEILLLIDGLKVIRWLINIINCYVILDPLTACIQILCLNIIFSPGIRDACKIKIGHFQSWGDNYKLLSPVTPLEPPKMSVFSFKVTNKFLISMNIFRFCHPHPTPGLKKTEYKIFSSIS